MINRIFILRSNKNWILGAIVSESALAIKHEIDVAYIPSSRKDFFSIDAVKFILKYIKWKDAKVLFVNQSSLFRLLSLNLGKNKLKNYRVLYTHDSSGYLPLNSQAEILKKTDRIMLFNNSSKIQLLERGITEDKMKVVYGAVDRNIFFPTKSVNEIKLFSMSKPYVLISGDNKSRKSPELIFEVIGLMPELDFIIHGNGWNTFNGVKTYNNLKIFEFKFENQPSLIRNAHVYLTVSNLEGGPYPTLEALASGTPVVATDTGWNRELINEKKGAGMVLPINPAPKLVAESIRKTLDLKLISAHTDLLDGNYTWEALGFKLFT
jgi:glycosyltransferase involved in cell wall biosynthesis